MIPDAMLRWRGDLILSSDLTVPGERSDFYSAVHRGEFAAVYRGVYMPTALWNGATVDERYLYRVHSAFHLDPGAVFSHQSAAALWRLPSVGGWPRHAHVFRANPALAARTSIFIRHALAIPAQLMEIDGLPATDLARTVLDIAIREPFGYAVAMADAALRRTDHSVAGLPTTSLTHLDLETAMRDVSTTHGSARARRVVCFADGRADRPGESMSRVAMDIARLPPPQIQVELEGASGRIYIVDFWWPEFGLIGEFDGQAKYQDPAFLNGRTPERALHDEKAREDDLRAAGHRMSRWGWTLALSPARLREHLVAAGLPSQIRRHD